MMNRIQLFLFLLLLISSSCEVDSADVVNDPADIPDEITEKISSLELVKANERILTVFYKKSTKIPSFETTKEEFLLLTDERFLRCFDQGVQEVKFSNCLDMGLDSTLLMSGEYIVYDISAKSIYKLMYDKNEQLNLLPDFKYIHYGGNIKYRADFQTLTSWVIRTWKNHSNYDSLRSLYKKFYDDNGNRIPTPTAR